MRKTVLELTEENINHCLDSQEKIYSFLLRIPHRELLVSELSKKARNLSEMATKLRK